MFNINNMQNRLNKIQEQLSTGSKINRLSDDIQNITKFFNLKGTLNKIETDLKEISPLTTFYKGVESQYDNGFNLITRAIDIAQTATSSIAGAQERTVLADEVQGIIDRILDTANFNDNGKNVLTGKNTDVYKKVADVINYEYSGQKSLKSILSENNFSLPDEKKIFGGFSDDYAGKIDLNPDISTDTKLSLLNFGKGVRLGKIIINDGTNSFTIDLSYIEKIQNVIDKINAASPTLTATLNANSNGLEVTSSTGTITISSDLGYKTAEDLGIAGNSISGTITGTALNPLLSTDTSISLLNGGSGIDLSGFNIENKTPSITFNAFISVAATDTVGDIINKINSSQTYTKAFISDDGRKINIVSTLQGGRLKLSENGIGTTLLNLGIFTDLANTKLENLFGGFGLPREEQTNDFKITRKDGVSFEINLTGATTVQDLLNKINLNPLNTDTNADTIPEIQATTAGNQIIITDTSIGTGTLTIKDINTNWIAQKLGIKGEFTTGTVTGADLNPVGSKPKGLFSALLELRDGLQTNDVELINQSLKQLQTERINFQSGQLQIADISGRLDLLNNKLTQLKENFTTQISETADLNIVETIIEFQKETTILQSALATSASVLTLSLFNFLI